jgi:hypothetical protein
MRACGPEGKKACVPWHLSSQVIHHYMCPHTAYYVCYYICVLILHPIHTTIHVSSFYYMLAGDTLLYMCPHTSYYIYYCICVLVLHTIYTIIYIYVLILLHARRRRARPSRATAWDWCKGPHTTIYVSSYYYICVLIVHVLVVQRHETVAKVLILLYMCPQSARPSRATAWDWSSYVIL